MIKDQDAAAHKAEEIWQNFLTLMIEDGKDRFQPDDWKYLKKALYPFTHENVRDFIPQPESVEIAMQYAVDRYKKGLSF